MIVAVFPKSPTCFRTPTGSYIDFFLTAPSLNLSNDRITTLPSFSDHFAIKLNIKFHNSSDINNIPITYSYSYANLRKLNAFISTELKKLNLQTNQNIHSDEANKLSSAIENIFEAAIGNFVPQLKIPVGKILLSSQTITLKNKYKSATRRFLRNRLKANANQLRSEANLIKNMYTNSVKMDLSNYYKKFISNTEVHNLIRQTTPYKKRLNLKNEILITNTNENVIAGTFDANQAFASNFNQNHILCESLSSPHTNEVYTSND